MLFRSDVARIPYRVLFDYRQGLGSRWLDGGIQGNLGLTGQRLLPHASLEWLKVLDADRHRLRVNAYAGVYEWPKRK